MRKGHYTLPLMTEECGKLASKNRNSFICGLLTKLSGISELPKLPLSHHQNLPLSTFVRCLSCSVPEEGQLSAPRTVYPHYPHFSGVDSLLLPRHAAIREPTMSNYLGWGDAKMSPAAGITHDRRPTITRPSQIQSSSCELHGRVTRSWTCGSDAQTNFNFVHIKRVSLFDKKSPFLNN